MQCTFTGAGTVITAEQQEHNQGTGTVSDPSATTGQAGTGVHSSISFIGVCEFDILTRGQNYVVGDNATSRQQFRWRWWSNISL